MNNQSIRTVGLVVGPGQIQYAVSEDLHGQARILQRGVLRFDNGLLVTKSGLVSAKKERTLARSVRRNYDRRKRRKIETLRLLSELHLCPEVTSAELDAWKYGNVYPKNAALDAWLQDGPDPYECRYRAAKTVLDMNSEADRFILGRALYHIAQRRGYMSTATAEEHNNDSNKVNSCIARISSEIAAAGCVTLGEYLYKKKGDGERVRAVYLSRGVHYEAELRYICRRQDVSKETEDRLYGVILTQRSLKTQKYNVGRCAFENTKYRTQVSHPRFEEYRMWSFINNIRIQGPADRKPRRLTAEETDRILPLFFRVSKPRFKFSEVTERLLGKKTSVGRFYEDAPWKVNYHPDTGVCGCPTIARIMQISGCSDCRSWEAGMVEGYPTVAPSGRMKTADDVMTEIWHEMIFAAHRGDVNKQEDYRREWLRKRFPGADEKTLGSVSEYNPDPKYANISITAVRRILPFLKEGYVLSEATYLANVDRALPDATAEQIGGARERIREIFNHRGDYQEDEIAGLILSSLNDFADGGAVDAAKLYRPGANDMFPAAVAEAEGRRRLPPVRTDSMKNATLQRALGGVRRVVNELVAQGVIDHGTKVNVAVEKEINSRNARNAYEKYMKDNEEANEKCRESIRNFYKETYGRTVNVSEDDLLKYKLWEEQKHVCLYTGNTIGLADFLGPDAKYDIEHTVPISAGGDDSMMNKTLCLAEFNRDVKKGQLPSELGEKIYGEFCERVKNMGMESELKKTEGQIAKLKLQAQTETDADAHDNKIRLRNRLQFRSNYLEGKIMRFHMKEVPHNFAFLQTGVPRTIMRFTVSYLECAFDKVTAVPENMVAAFRREWGLPSDYEYTRDSDRISSIDAAVLSCITYRRRVDWERYWKSRETYRYARKPVFQTPWEGFAEDVLNYSDIIPYRRKDSALKGRKFKVRDASGKLRRDKNGNVMYQKSDRAGAEFCKGTYYGRIERNGKIEKVLRRPVEAKTFNEKFAGKIVDPILSGMALDAIKTYKEDAAGHFLDPAGKTVRHIRVFEGGDSGALITIKQQRDRSEKDYKNGYVCSSEDKYAIAVYEDGSSLILDYFDAAAARKEGRPVIPERNGGAELMYALKKNTTVIFYENDPSEINPDDRKDIAARMYRVNCFHVEGTSPYVLFVKSDEARTVSKLQKKMGHWKDLRDERILMGIQPKNLHCLVEGKDFTIDCLGNIHIAER